jgi:hypothetical protein
MRSARSIESGAPRLLGSLVLLIANLFLCASCANLFSGSSSKTGSVAISIASSSAKAVVPGASDYSAAIAAYKIVVSGNGNTYTSTTVSSGICTITGIVAGSGYAVSVYAYSDAAATTQIASGSASGLTIGSGSSASVSITLSFTQTASTGGFSLPITWPCSAAASFASAIIDGNVNATATAVATTTLDSIACYTTTLSAAGLSGGTHLLAIYFTSSSGTTLGPFYESVNI